MLNRAGFIFLLVVLAAALTWAQADSPAQPAASGNSDSEDRMITPTPVSVGSYSLEFVQETPRTNYLRGGISFGAAYDDNVLGGVSGHPVSDIAYSVWPTIALRQSRSRLQWDFAYSPGFTFYQRTSSRNQADHNLGLNLAYRLSPHVTLTVRDNFEKTSNFFSLVSPGTNATASGSGVTPGPNESVIAPIADRITNLASQQITYQFSPNGMVGASGSFTELRYPKSKQHAGLFE
jgi:hypothetical protein